MTVRPLKVMHILARMNVGGPALHAALLLDHLDQGAFEQRLVYGQISENEGDMSYLLDDKDPSVSIIIPELGREISPLRDLNTIYKLYRLMRREKPDIVHTHTAKAGFTGRIAAWLARVPARVHTFHGHVFSGYFSPLKTTMFIWIERFCARLTNRIIAISPSQRDAFVKEYAIAPHEKFTVLPYGFDLDEVMISPGEDALSDYLKQHDIPADKKLVFIVGRLVPIKNHDLFLRMAAKVLNKRDDAHFVIVGDGETRPALEKQVRELDISQHVTFTGWLRDVRLVFHQKGIFALASKNEGTPVTIIEAMAAGMPVVSTAVGGVADVLGDGRYGLLVPPGDADAFADAIDKALDNQRPDPEEARGFSLERYGIPRFKQDMEALYRELVSLKPIQDG